MAVMSEFTVEQASEILASSFAPWVRDLDLTIEEVGPARAVLRMKHSDRLARTGGMVCGQALMALADTAMVFAVCGAAGGMRPMTTVSQTTNFMRAISGVDVIAEAKIVRLGRTMAFGEIYLRGADRDEPSVQVTSTNALLDA